MTTMTNQSKTFHIKEPGSAITHFIALIACIASAGPLLVRGVEHNVGTMAMVCYVAFLVGACLLYTASTCYHTFDLSPRGNKNLKKFDHMMIPMLIAGTYTPASLLGQGGFLWLLMGGTFCHYVFIYFYLT